MRQMEVLAATDLPAAQRLFVTIAEAFEAGQVVQQARAANPRLAIVARAHSDAEVEHLDRPGADPTVMGEREIAYRMIEWTRQSNVTGDPAGSEALLDAKDVQVVAGRCAAGGQGTKRGEQSSAGLVDGHG
jgi:voltage-gated potassium channel Kch